MRLVDIGFVSSWSGERYHAWTRERVKNPPVLVFPTALVDEHLKDISRKPEPQSERPRKQLLGIVIWCRPLEFVFAINRLITN